VDNNLPFVTNACVLACGETAWAPSDVPNVDIALPYGACAAGTPACQATARQPCSCRATLGPVQGFVCTCEGGQWKCLIRSQGGAACACDAGTGPG
jgi:hypothetical protein